MTFSSNDPDANPSPGLWLGLSIASSLLCCLPIGIVGIIYAALALGAQNRQDWDDAARKARMAKNWTIASIVLGVIAIVVICISGLGSSS